MTTLEVLRDNREQKGWGFENQDVTIRDETLSTGDYTLEVFCDHDITRDTYIPSFAIERKSGDDFVSSITSDRERFKSEIKRASDWDRPLCVIIEEPRKPSRYQDSHYLDFYNITEPQVLGIVETWEECYNVQFSFARSRELAQQQAYDTLSMWLRSYLFE